MGLVITYPLMKRITYWPQAVLGNNIFCGNDIDLYQGLCNQEMCYFGYFV